MGSNMRPRDSAIASQICCFRDVLSSKHELPVLVIRSEVLRYGSTDHFWLSFIAGEHEALLCL